jgi:tetratricopeptide (TPR) repeat protein
MNEKANTKSPKQKVRSGRGVIVLWVAVAGVLLAVAGSLLFFLLPSRRTDQTATNRNPGSEPARSSTSQTGSATPDRSQQIQPVAASVRGEAFARQGQWADSAKEALAEVTANPAERSPWSKAGVLLLLAGDGEEYRRLCGRMIEQFRGTTNVLEADVLCKTCLLRPDGADRSQLPSRVLIDEVEQARAQLQAHRWLYACLALLAYRDGKFEQAVDRCKQSLAINKGTLSDGALALLVQAMAQHQLKQADPARKALTQATAIIPHQLATLGSTDFQGTLPVSADVVGVDLLIAEVLRREAALLIHKDARRPVDAAALREKGLQLLKQGKPDEALTVLRQALEQEETHGQTHHLVGVILANQAKLDEAVREFRRAIELAPGFLPAHLNLGEVLYYQDKLEEARAVLNKVLERNAKIGPAHTLLGRVLLQEGKLDEADAAFNKALALNPRDGTARGVLAEVKRLQPLLPKLDRFLDGTEKPADNAQRLDLAQLCHYRRRFIVSARFYAEALDADATLRDDPAHLHRYNAACAAVRASQGDGDAEKLDAAERIRLRKQAIAWLRAELDIVTKVLAAASPAERPRLLPRLHHWKLDADLASLRDAERISKLPEDEQALLKGIWSDLDAALKRPR